MSVRPPAWLVWSIVALQVALVALKGVLRVVEGDSAGQLVGALSILSFPAVGALIFWWRPNHPVGWLFCAVNLGWALNNFASTYARYAVASRPGSLPAGEVVVWLYGWLSSAAVQRGLVELSTGLLSFLVLLFPNGTLPSPRWRPLAWLVAGSTAVGALASAFAPGPNPNGPSIGISNPFGLQGPIGHLLAQVSRLNVALTSLLFCASAIALLLRLRRARGHERQQLKWFVGATAVVAVLSIAFVALSVRYGSRDVMPGWAQLLIDVGILSISLIPAAAGVAILRYRLYDIDLLINRTLVYGALTATLAVAYWGGVLLLQQLLRPLTQGSELAGAGATLAVAALFRPLRRRIQAAVDRRFYRRKYDAERTLAAFSARLRHEVDLDSLRQEVVTVVQETMQPAQVSLWLRPSVAGPGARSPESQVAARGGRPGTRDSG